MSDTSLKRKGANNVQCARSSIGLHALKSRGSRVSQQNYGRSLCIETNRTPTIWKETPTSPHHVSANHHIISPQLRKRVPSVPQATRHNFLQQTAWGRLQIGKVTKWVASMCMLLEGTFSGCGKAGPKRNHPFWRLFHLETNSYLSI